LTRLIEPGGERVVPEIWQGRDRDLTHYASSLCLIYGQLRSRIQSRSITDTQHCDAL
jgi:hypothetical protein